MPHGEADAQVTRVKPLLVLKLQVKIPHFVKLDASNKQYYPLKHQAKVQRNKTSRKSPELR